MNFIKEVRSTLLNFRIKGRASRSEYCHFFIMIFLLAVLLSPILVLGISHAKSIVSIGGVVGLIALFLPLIVSGSFLAIRRLHDLNFSGWYWLLFFALSQIGGLGLLAHLFLMCKKGTKGANRFGDDPIQDPTLLDA